MLNRFLQKLALLLASVLMLAAPAFAQNYPLAAQTPVTCTGCAGTNTSGQANDGLPTTPFTLPLADFVGRYVDSNATIDVQNVGFRTARAGRVRIAPTTRGSAPPRAYVQIGEAIGAYTLDSFFSTELPGGTVPVSRVNTGSQVGGAGRTPLEEITLFDAFAYPEAKNSGWMIELRDGQQRLGDFDYDDRGYVYAAYMLFGFGIMQDTGGTGQMQLAGAPCKDNTGAAIQCKSQISNGDSGVPARTTTAIKSGNKYYAVISTDQNLAFDGARVVYDVTNPANPVRGSVLDGQQYAMLAWARDEVNKRIGIVTGKNHVQIYDYAAFVSGGSPLVDYTPTGRGEYTCITVDEDGRFWAGEAKNSPNSILRITPSGNGYTSTLLPLLGSTGATYLDAHAKYLAVAVKGGTSSTYDVKLFSNSGGSLSEIDLGNYFNHYYHNAPAGHAQPYDTYSNWQRDIKIVEWGGKTYLMYSDHGLGDVYELQGGDSISVVAKNTSPGTTNPNAKPTESGPFYGDFLTFGATSSNPAQSYNLTWDFGDGTLASGHTGTDIRHQWTGLTSAAAITANKTVTATATTNADITDDVIVSMKVPTPRVGVTGSTAVYTASSALDVVVDDSFTDASDGVVEGHFGTWTLDSGTPQKVAPNATVSAGGVGSHTMRFTGSYGAYNPDTFALSSPYVTPAITLTYDARPFLFTLKTPVASNANIVFGATPRVTPNTAILFGTSWDIHWEIKDGVTDVVPPVNTTANVGTIPNFPVAKALIPDGAVVTLTITMDPAGLSAAAANYNSYTQSLTLTIPDPKITRTNCTNALGPCTLTGGSVSGASTTDWSWAWVLSKNGTQVSTGTGKVWSPTLPSQGTYDVTLTATRNGVFDGTATTSFPVGAVLCGPPPTADNLSFSTSCNDCNANTSITFRLGVFGYTLQDCDTVTWDFGDGGTATGATATHSFSSNKTYTVKVKVTNTNGFGQVSQSVVIGGGSPPPPPPTCDAPSNIDFSWSGSLGCSPGIACKTGEVVRFTALRGLSGLLTCDNASWNFGDGSTSTAKSPTHTFTSTGSKTVTVRITNSGGDSGPVSHPVSIVQGGGGGSCALTPNEGSFSVEYSGPQSGCSSANSTPCSRTEAVQFDATPFGYTIQGCDTFTWDFGDGTPVSGTAASHTFGGNSNAVHVTLTVANTNLPGGVQFAVDVPFVGGTPQKPTPNLDSSAFPTTGSTGQAVSFTVTSNIPATGWAWDFGDGVKDNSHAANSGTTDTITHVFARTGQFTVKVNARNAEDVANAPTGQASRRITISQVQTLRYLLPVVVHSGGQAGSVWRTDVQIYNPDPNVSEAHPMVVTASFNGVTKNLTIPHATVTFSDFLRTTMFPDAGDWVAPNDSRSGSMIISVPSTFSPKIWTRTYNQTDAGTFGQLIPAVPLDGDGAGGGAAVGTGTYYLAGLRHDSRYRTNLGFVNPTLNPINATISVYDEDRIAIGSFDITLNPFALVQFTLRDMLRQRVPEAVLPDDTPFSVNIDVPEGQWVISYASYIDGLTNDPVYVPAVRSDELESDDFRSEVLTGVGHYGQWRSDVTIFNPDQQGVTFDLLYYDANGNKLAEAKSLTLRPFDSVQYQDLLTRGILAPQPPDSLGMLRVNVVGSNGRFPLTYARTYFDKGPDGTYGQGIGSFSAARANVKAGHSAVIPAIRVQRDAQDPQKFVYYTNIGVVNVSATVAHVTLTALDASTGAAVGTESFDVNPNQTLLGFNNRPWMIDGATILIQATGGDVWAFASIIDGRTSDPEYVPAAPLN